MQNYTLAEGQQGEKVLMINEKQSVCPYVPAILIKGQMGQMQIMRMPCTSLCPLVKMSRQLPAITADEEKLYYYTNCGHGVMCYPIDETAENPNESGTILKMV